MVMKQSIFFVFLINFIDTIKNNLPYNISAIFTNFGGLKSTCIIKYFMQQVYHGTRGL